MMSTQILLEPVIESNKLRSFDPIENANASVLILGSMPGAESLRRKQYYAHNRNSFWKIMSTLLGFSVGLEYAERSQMLRDSGIALWDVLKFCERQGSLDSAIKDETTEPNDFTTFFQHHPQITDVFFNGTKAQVFFKRLVMPNLVERRPALKYERLPSTSPAHAAMSLNQKIECWRVITRNHIVA